MGTEKIKIRGANYEAIDTGDSYFTLKDVPLMSEVTKGTKGAPKDVTETEIKEFVENGQRQSNDPTRPRHAPAFIRHNPDTEFGQLPEFSGFVVPTKAGKYKFDDGEKWTAFGDVKVNSATMDRIKKGELPAHSPEVDWKKNRISGLAFLSTQPPYFEYATNTIGEVTVDHAAQFSAFLDDEFKGKFMNEPTDVPAKPEDLDGKIAQAISKFVAEELPKHLDTAIKKLTPHNPAKTEPLPIEPDGGTPVKETSKMQMDPEFAAKFAAQAQKVSELEGKFLEQENEKKVAVLMEKADAILARKVINSDVRGAVIGKFAKDSLGMKDGEKWFVETVEKLKLSLRDKPPSTVAEFQSGSLPATDPGDPVVSKFAAEGPDAMEQVGKFASQWRQIKAQRGDNFSCPEEEFIKNELVLWKASRNGSLNETRR